MKKSIFVLLTIISTFSACKKETVRVSGTVIDSSSSNPIEGAEVELYCKVWERLDFVGSSGERTGEEVVYTDENGFFSLELVAHCDEASVVLKKEGYSTYSISSNSEIDMEHDNVVEVKMEPCGSAIQCY
jgi:hypothetical protein